MSKEVYDELVANGAPELPDGYFYRIESWSGPGMVKGFDVSIRRGRHWWSYQVSETVFIPQYRDEAVVNFAYACKEAHTSWTRRTFADRQTKHFAGVHP